MNQTQSTVAKLLHRLAAPYSSPRNGRSPLACALLVLLLGLCVSTLRLGAATVEAQLDRTTATLGETVALSLQVEGASLRGGQPPIPAVPGLQIAPAGQSSQISIVNGRRSMQLQMNYQIEATRVGDYTIPSISIPTDAGTLRTRPLSLKITCRPYEEAMALRIGQALQRATDWHLRMPAGL